MVDIIPYLYVENGKKAIEIYEDLFGAQIRRHEKFTTEIGRQLGFPDNFDYEASTMHASLDIHGSMLYLADRTSPIQDGNNIEIAFEADSLDEIQAIFNKAKEKGYEFKLELQLMFWGGWFMRFVDELGIGWQFNFTPEQPDSSQE